MVIFIVNLRRHLPFLASMAALFGAVSAPAAIIIDGTDFGNTFVLSSNATSVTVNEPGDMLTIQGNANVSGSLNVSDGNVLLTGGNLNLNNGGLSLSGGRVTLDRVGNLNFNGLVNATGGALFVEDVSNFTSNPSTTFSGNAVGFFADGVQNVNTALAVLGDSSVFFDSNLLNVANPFPLPSGTDPDGRVSFVTGQISGQGNNIIFATTPDRNIFIGADRSDAENAITPAAVPEPTRSLIALFGFSVALFARHRK